MIIGYLYIVSIAFMPLKTNAPLLVDAYGIVSFSISLQYMLLPGLIISDVRLGAA
jgi:hypothetical protein